MKRNWPCNPICSLCTCIHETTTHILTKCNYIEALWNLIATRLSLSNYTQMIQNDGPKEWVATIPRGGTRRDKADRLGILFSFWWGLWKEHNKRTFNHEDISTKEVAQLIINDIDMVRTLVGG
jgi:hypothetical protein